MTQEQINAEGTALAYALFSLRKLCRHWVARNEGRGHVMLVYPPDVAMFNRNLTPLGRSFFTGRTASEMAAYSPPRMSESREQDIAKRHSAIARQYLIDMGATP